MSTANPRTSPKVQQCGDVTVLTFTADATRDVEDVLARELGRLTVSPGDHLLLDFTNVTYLNSTEIGTLIGLHKRLQAAGSRLTLFNLNDRLLAVFRVTRLDVFLTICTESDGVGDDSTPPDGTPLVDLPSVR